MICYPSDVWTSPAWQFHGLTQAPVHTVVFVSSCSRGAGEAIGAGLFVDGGAAQDAQACGTAARGHVYAPVPSPRTCAGNCPGAIAHHHAPRTDKMWLHVRRID